MKKFIGFILAVCLLASVSLISVAAYTFTYEYSGSSSEVVSAASESSSSESSSAKKYVIDDLDVLTDAEEKILEQKLKELSDKYDMDFVFLSVKSAGHSDYYRIAYADDTYDYGGYRTDGVLYMYEDESTFKYLSTSGKCINALDGGEKRGYDDNSEVIDSILDDLDYYTDRGEYYNSVTAFIEDMDYYIGYYSEEGETRRVYAPYPFLLCLIVSVGAGLLVGGIAKKREKKKLNTVAANPYAGDYITENGVNITGGNDLFLYSTVSRTPRQTATTSRGGGGGGVHTHSGSSGMSHGGGGRH